MATPSKPVGSSGRQIPWGDDREVSGRCGLRAKPDGLMLDCREKALARLVVPVPQTDTGGRVEDTKANGRTFVKELGKLTP